MSILSEMKKKYSSKKVATATPATPATQEGEWTEEVAKVATVAVANPWEGEIEEAANDTRQQRVEDMLANNPELKYAVLVEDATTDPVIVTVGIRGLAVFNLEIPHAHYDGLALLQILEEHSSQETTGGDTQGSTGGKERSTEPPDEKRKTA
jgi:hypothetical protein